MKLQIISDLHLEFPVNFKTIVSNSKIKPTGDILIIAGDLSYFSKKELSDAFFDEYKQYYKKIIYIPGNHEYYHGTINKENSIFLTETDNVVSLNNNVYIIDNVRFLCTTLWSGALPIVQNKLSDYSQIFNFSIIVENNTFNYCKKWLETKLQEPFSGKTVVVTHHLPLKECISNNYKNSSINSGFVSDQSSLFKNYNFDAWIHGHSHSFYNDKHFNKLVVRNSFGYFQERYTAGFKYDFFVEI